MTAADLNTAVQSYSLQIQQIWMKAKHPEAVFSELIKISRERQAQLIELARRDPQQALRITLPPTELSRYPFEVRNILESQITLQGAIAIVVSQEGDGQDPRAEMSLITLDERRYELVFSGAKPWSLSSGAMLRVNGLRIGNLILVTDHEQL